MAVDDGKSGWVNDRFRAAGAGDLMADITGDFRIGKAGEIIVDGDPLMQSLMDGLAEGVVQVRFAAEDEGKAVDGKRFGK